MKVDVASITTYLLLLVIYRKKLGCSRTEKGKAKPLSLSHPSTSLSYLNMKVKALVGFKTKLSGPCRKILVLLRLKKPLYVRPRGPRSSHASARHRAASLFSVFRSQRKSKVMNRVRELTDPGKEKLISTLPLTPVSAKSSCGTGMKTETMVVEDVVEEACRSFEKYLLEMIVEEGNVRDLMDIEELLYCWKNLKSPVFTEMVSRFYGELCKDLFSPEQ